MSKAERARLEKGEKMFEVYKALWECIAELEQQSKEAEELVNRVQDTVLLGTRQEDSNHVLGTLCTTLPVYSPRAELTTSLAPECIPLVDLMKMVQRSAFDHH